MSRKSRVPRWVAVASDAYPVGKVLEAWRRDAEVGDGLAQFIADELRDVTRYDEAVRRMENASEELRLVARALRDGVR